MSTGREGAAAAAAANNRLITLTVSVSGVMLPRDVQQCRKVSCSYCESVRLTFAYE